MAQRDYMRIGAGQSPVAGDDVPVTIVVNPDGSNVSGGGSGSSGGSVQRALIAEGMSTTSGTAGVSGQILPADPNRKKVSFQNAGSAPIALRINVGADNTDANATPPAAGTTAAKRMIFVPAGQYYVTEPDELCTGTVKTASLTASQAQAWAAS